jgi:hypothetical protein
MRTRRQFKQPSLFRFRSIQEAYNLRRQAEGMPSSVRRDELLRKANQIDTAVHFKKSLSPNGLRAPTIQ